MLALFDNRNNHNGELIDPNEYNFKLIDIFVDTGDLIPQQIASLTRWELMESSPDTALHFTIQDPYSFHQSKNLRSLIPYKYIQAYLRKNPIASRVILELPVMNLFNSAQQTSSEK
jgi:hypothetical protein